jgi:hypothetical protein
LCNKSLNYLRVPYDSMGLEKAKHKLVSLTY